MALGSTGSSGPPGSRSARWMNSGSCWRHKTGRARTGRNCGRSWMNCPAWAPMMTAAAMPQLACWSILDAWEAWQVHGTLCPAWVDPGTLGRIPERDLDAAWERDALLDDVDAVLAAAGMGSARDWTQLVPVPVPE